MIVRRWSREQIMNSLGDKISRKKPLFFASCGTGLVAKLLEKAGCDSISTYSGGRLKSNGL